MKGWTNIMLQEGDRLLIVYRRMFESDQSRMFIGNVEAYLDGIVRLAGYTIARDVEDSDYCRKTQKQTKLFALSSGTLIVYVLPRDFVTDQSRIDVSELTLTLTDGQGHELNISEWFRRA